MISITGELLSEDKVIATVKKGEITDCDDTLLPLYLKRTKDFEGWLASRAIDTHRTNSRLLKKALRLHTADDAQIALAVNAAGMVIDNVTEHFFVPATPVTFITSLVSVAETITALKPTKPYATERETVLSENHSLTSFPTARLAAPAALNLSEAADKSMVNVSSYALPGAIPPVKTWLESFFRSSPFPPPPAELEQPAKNSAKNAAKITVKLKNFFIDSSIRSMKIYILKQIVYVFFHTVNNFIM